jgi:hypothetical protein
MVLAEAVTKLGKHDDTLLLLPLLVVICAQVENSTPRVPSVTDKTHGCTARDAGADMLSLF